MNTLFQIENEQVNTTRFETVKRDGNTVRVTLLARRDSKFSSLEKTATKYFNEWQRDNYTELGYKSSTFTATERADHNQIMFYYTAVYKLNGMEEAQPADLPKLADLQRARFDAQPAVISMRSWIDTLKMSDDALNDTLQEVEEALVRFANTKEEPTTPDAITAFQAMEVKAASDANAILDVYMQVCERLS